MRMGQDSRDNTFAVAGIVQVGVRTKELLRTLRKGAIAVIHHEDLDRLAAEGLAEAQVQAVLNGAPTVSGRFPHAGAEPLLERGIPVYDIPEEAFGLLRDGMRVAVRRDGTLEAAGCAYICRPVTPERLAASLEPAPDRWRDTCLQFIENTLAHAALEKEAVFRPLQPPKLRIRMQGRPAVVVSRGADYQEDLRSLAPYIQRAQPVLIGVDGGADALLAAGWRPHCIVGDMDSVSDRALRCGAELIVHAYANGYAPGWKRVRRLGLQAHALFVPGTSEDLALLLAYELQAESLVTVGAHTHAADFLSKGRAGMASTLLVRMKIGHKLIDAKGLSRLFPAAAMEPAGREQQAYV